MPDMKLLTEELEEIAGKRSGLRAKYSGVTMPESEREEDERLVNRAKEVRGLIEEERQRERDADFGELSNWLAEPRHQAPRGINPDDESRKGLARAGWESKGGMMVRQTSLGELAFCPEEVLFGPVPNDDEVAAKYFKQTRAIFQPSYRAAYEKWLRMPIHGPGADNIALGRLSPAEQNALSEGLDPSGGFLVPPDVMAELLVRLPQRSVMRRLARTVNTSRDKLQWPAVKAHATSGSIYSSGFVGGWAGETPTFSDTDPVFEQFEIAIKKIRVGTKLSNDWIADAAADVLAFLARNGAENMALVEDEGFIAGTGLGLQPLGLLNAGIATADVEGSSANTISNTVSAAGSSPKIQAMAYALPSQYADGAQWLMRRAIEGDVRALVDANGRPIWLSYNEGGLAASPRSIMGYAVNNSEFMENDGVDAAKVIAFGDFSNYLIAQRASVATVVLRERFADSEQTGILITERVGGGVWNTDAFRIGIV